MNILVTGTDGYIGCLMAPLLIERGHDIVGLDTGYFREARLGGEPTVGYPTLAKDLRHVTAEDLAGFDAVVHLAGLSNDALGKISSEVTYEINHDATVRLAQLAKAAGVSRFVYSSSCSVYGRPHGTMVDETSAVDPQTDYAKCKVLDEEALGALADERFTPTFLRNATAYGASPRMRFDLVVNDLSALAWTTKQIAMLSDGTPWRPIVHVLDICEAFAATLASPREAVHNEAFNVGATEENYQVREIAQTVADVFPGCTLSFGQSDPDQRSYKVSFDKVHQQLPGFRTRWTLRRGVEQLHELYERVQLTGEMHKFRAYTRLNQLLYLRHEGRIDQRFFWRE